MWQGEQREFSPSRLQKSPKSPLIASIYLSFLCFIALNRHFPLYSVSTRPQHLSLSFPFIQVMESSDDDHIYSANDLFDPAAALALEQELRRPLSPPRPMPKAPTLPINRLGINVGRWLLTYLCLEDMIRFTSTCRWLYKIGLERDVLERYGGQIAGNSKDQEWSLRKAYLESKRIRALITNQEKKLGKTVLFDQNVTNLFHVENMGLTRVYFSLSQSKVVLWILNKSKIDVRATFPGPQEVLSHIVTPSLVVVLGRSELVLNHCHWSILYNIESTATRYQFPIEETEAFVRLIEATAQIATIRGNTVHIFDTDLHSIRLIELDQLRLCFPHFVLLPSRLQPYLVTVSNSHYFLLDSRLSVPIFRKKLKFLSVSQADCLVITEKEREKSYLIVLGVLGIGNRLIANGNHLCSFVQRYVLQGSQVICFISPNKIVIFEADMERISEISSITFTSSLNCDHFAASSSLYIVQSHTWIKPNPTLKPLFATQFSYLSQNGWIMHTESLEMLQTERTFLFRSELIAVGKYEDCRTIVILHFFQDSEPTELTLGELYTFWNERNQMYSRCRLSEEEKNAQFVSRREERNREKEKESEYQSLKRSKYWKGKRNKHFRYWLRCTILDSLTSPLSLNVAV